MSSISTKWTKEQLAAIETKGCNLLVAAGAGSGKTAVLVERIIRKVTDIENPLDIDRLLVVTFTNAAASEMRERIGDAISKELDKNPDSKIFQRQLTLLPKARITTVHSFCLDVIKNNFHKINIDPNFRISDDTESILLKQEAIEELFDSKYEEEDNDKFLMLVECYGGNKSDDKLGEMILSIYEFAESSPFPDKWLIQAAEVFNVNDDFDFEESKWAKYILKNIKIEITGLVANMQRAIDVIKNNPELDVYTLNFEAEMEQLLNIVKHAEISWSSLNEYLNQISFGRLKACKNVDENLKKSVIDIRDKVKKSIKKIQGTVMGFSEEKIIIEMRRLHPIMRALADLVIEFKNKFRDKKRERGVIDFSDIEHYALEILTDTSEDADGDVKPSEVALKYRENFEEVLIDEYQDSNLVQEVMLKMVSRNGEEVPNLFMVGDVKQSIYRFRQAMPELFLSKYNEYSEGEGLEQKITLFKNFRSRREVIDGVNYIFRQIMSENIGELNYNEREELNLGAEYCELEGEGSVGGPIELHIIESRKAENEGNEDEDSTEESADEVEDEDDDVDNMELEARMVGSRIKRLFEASEGKEFKVYDKSLGTYRKAEYKDIVILLRSTKNWSRVFLDEFSRQGIPAFADTGTGYFDTIEIKTMLSLLQVIDNPMQDIPLLSVLRSPLYSFTPEELIDIRLENEKGSFFEALRKIAENRVDSLAIKAGNFIHDIQKWQNKSIHTSVDEFLWEIYMETGYFGYVSAMPGGVQRQANLKVLFERARQYEETSYRGLFNFINFINRLKRNNGDMGSAKILGENENVVRIMSIHKSKGLEFPIVILSGAGKGFNFMDLRGSILLHKELGFGPDFIDYKRRYTYSSTMKEAIKTRLRLETLSEEMRVLYVAFTRAKEKLIITGSVKNIEKSSLKWGNSSEKIENKLSEYEVMTSKSYLDWICPSVMNHRDSEELINISGIQSKNNIDSLGNWEINLWDRKTILAKSEEDTETETIEIDDISSDKNYSEYGEEIEKRLGFTYSYEKAYTLPAKLSVSELKRVKNLELLDEDAAPLFNETILKRPAFFETKTGFTAAEKGTLMHLTMQHMDLRRVSSIEQINEQITSMVRDEIITKGEAEAINTKKIEGFFKSFLGKRMTNSVNVMREIPFTVELPADKVYNDLPVDKYSKEYIMLQGVIDCFFEEDGEFILIDYKTDYVEDGNIESIKERYKLQIDYYSMALERISGKRVKEKYIYLFYNGETIKY